MWSLGISLIELALGRFPFSDSDDDSDAGDGSMVLDSDAEYDLGEEAVDEGKSEKPPSQSNGKKRSYWLSKGIGPGGVEDVDSE